MILNLVLVVAILWGFRLLLDAHRLIRKAITAIDRDQDIMDQITVHEPADEDHGGPEFAIDMSWDEQTAVLEFIEQFRAIKTHYERRQQ